MGELLCHMWLLGLPCSLGGDEWLRDNIFYLFIRFSLMSKNRKCGWDHRVAPLVQKKKEKKKKNIGPNIKEFSISLCSSTEIRDIFSPFIFDFFQIEYDINVRCMALFHTFSKYSLCSCVFRVQVQSSTGPPASAMESQVLFTHLNEIHFDVTFERITSAWGSREEVSSLLFHWLKHTTTHL